MGIFKRMFGSKKEERDQLAGRLPLTDANAVEKLSDFREMLARREGHKVSQALEASPEDIRFVEHLLGDAMAGTEAARWLASHYMRRSEWKSVESLVKHRDSMIRANSTMVIAEETENGADVIPGLPSLGEALKDPNEGVREGAAKAILAAALKERTREPAILILGAALSEEPSRMVACASLSRAAERGVDIRPAIERLGEMLPESGRLGETAAEALLFACMADPSRDPAVSELRNALSHKSEAVRGRVAGTLSRAALAGADISIAIPALGNAIYDRNADVKVKASEALMHAAEKGVHISSAIPALGNGLGDQSEEVCDNCEKALGHAVASEKTSEAAASVLRNMLSDKTRSRRASRALRNALEAEPSRDMAISVFSNALSDKDPESRRNAVMALGTAAEKGMDISSTLPLLVQRIADGNEGVAKETVLALCLAAANEKTREATVAMLGNQLSAKSGRMKICSARALASIAERGIMIKEAIPAASASLKDKSVRSESAWLLGVAGLNGIDISPAMHELGVCLSKGDIKLRLNAGWAILEASTKGMDILPAVQALGDALDDRQEYIRMNAAKALVNAGLYERSRGPALSAIGEALLRSRERARESASWASLVAAESGIDMAGIVNPLAKALSGGSEAVKVNCVLALLAAAEGGTDVSPALPALGGALSERSGLVRRHAVKAILEAQARGMGIAPAVTYLERALDDQNPEVRGLASRILAAERGKPKA